jgi:hypothetical protein
MSSEVVEQLVGKIESIINSSVGFSPEEDEYLMSGNASSIRQKAETKGISMAQRLMELTYSDLDYLKSMVGKNFIHYKRLSNLLALAAATLVHAQILNYSGWKWAIENSWELENKIQITKRSGMIVLLEIEKLDKSPDTEKFITELKRQIVPFNEI